MKKSRFGALFLAATLLALAFCGAASVSGAPSEEEEKKDDCLAIAFTHDMHSHLENQASLATAYKELDKSYSNILKVDGGDFAMGTLYQTIYQTQAAELRMLGKLGVDVTCLGNHEFDYKCSGFSNMLNSALDSGEDLPYFMVSGIDWDSSLADETNKAAAQELKKTFDRYGEEYEYDPSSYIMIEKGDYKIAVFSLFGVNALDCTPNSELAFYEPVSRAEEIVKEIKTNENADIIVCLSHSGTAEDGSDTDSEDEILAEKVPDIDVIVSAHTHTVLEKPIISGNTYIVSCGDSCENFGLLELKKNSEGRFDLLKYELNDVESYRSDEKVQSYMDGFTPLINEEFLSQYGYDFEEPMAYNSATMPQKSSDLDNQELALGNIVTDSYIYAVKEAEGADYVKVDVAVAPSGLIRAPLLKGALTVSDTFNVLSVGSGLDGTTGYPLVSAWLTGKELKAAAEIDASVSSMMSDAVLYFSGLQYTQNPNRLFLNRVTEVGIATGEPDDDEYEPVDDEKLYRVVSDLYSMQMLSTVTDLSHGILSIVPKDADGNPIENYEDIVVYGSFGEDENGNPLSHGELKAWYALTSYVNSFTKNSQGIAQVPGYYTGTHDRKLIEDSTAIADLIKAPNLMGKIALGIVGFILLIILLLIVLLIRKIAKKRKSKVVFIHNYKFRS